MHGREGGIAVSPDFRGCATNAGPPTRKERRRCRVIKDNGQPCNTLLSSYNMESQTCFTCAQRIARGHKPEYAFDPDAPPEKPRKGRKKKADKKATAAQPDVAPSAPAQNADQNVLSPPAAEAKPSVPPSDVPCESCVCP